MSHHTKSFGRIKIRIKSSKSDEEGEEFAKKGFYYNKQGLDKHCPLMNEHTDQVYSIF